MQISKFLLTLPMKMEQGSEASTYKNETPGDHPKERIHEDTPCFVNTCNCLAIVGTVYLLVIYM